MKKPGTPHPRKPAAAKRPATRRKASAREVDVIRHSRDIMLMPGLFGLGGDGATQEHVSRSEAGTLTLKWEPLSAYDLRMLCAVMTLTHGIGRGMELAAYESGDTTPDGAEAWDMLGFTASHDASAKGGGWRAYVITTSRRQLGELISGKASTSSIGGEDTKRCMDSLDRLASVRVRFRSKDHRGEFISRLLNGIARIDDKIRIILNPHLVAAVVDRARGEWALISTNAVRRLRGDVAPLLYHRLCAIIDMGCSRRFNEDTLFSYVWRDPVKDSADAAERRRLLLAALNQFRKLDPSWTVIAHEAKRGVMRAYTLTRPRQEQLALELLPIGDDPISPPAALLPAARAPEDDGA